jgi:hypothetical protein
MYLITSGDYVNQELQTEFGKIPPAFLPVQNKRLFNHQLKIIPSEEKVYLSIPATYCINDKDKFDLRERNVTILSVPEGLTLGQSIVYVLNLIGKYDQVLKIIHGDTLFDKIDFSADIFIISNTTDNYAWAYTKPSTQESLVYAGFFSFSKQQELIKLILENNYDFIKAITQYKKFHKIVEINLKNWYDFGHLNTYYRSKSFLTTQREFNNLYVNNQVVRKVSNEKNKILAEANWFKKIPQKLKVFTPQIYNSGENSGSAFYEIEYLYLSTLSELFVFGNNHPFIYTNILKACQYFIDSCYKFQVKGEIAPTMLNNSIYYPKTRARLLDFSKQTNIDLEKPFILNDEEYPSLLQIAEVTSKLIKPLKGEEICVIHGDFCFSNILYDFRTQNIKVVDPRGLSPDGEVTIYGDIRYDIAKLAHSVIGLYDHIVAQYFGLVEIEPYKYKFELFTNETTQIIQDRFIQMRFIEKTLEELDTFPILAQLFLSMLPLHNDNKIRQKALMLNALRMYKLCKHTI